MRSSLAACTAFAASAALLGARQEPRFHAAADVVSIYATVVDDDGRLVTDLTQDDFAIYDDGRLQPMSVFASEVQPIAIVIMLDRSGSVAGNLSLVEKAAEELVANLLPEDKARIGTFSRRIRIQPARFTQDQGELVRILRGDLQKGGPTPLWDATAAAMDALLWEEGRRVVLMFTDGRNSPEGLDAGLSFADVRDRSRREGAMVYGIGLVTDCEMTDVAAPGPFDVSLQSRGGSRGGRGGRIMGGRIQIPIGRGRIGLPGTGGLPRPAPTRPYVPTSRCVPSEPDPDLRQLAADGGGGYFELRRADDLGATFARVAEELHRQYLLAFPASSRDGRVHTLDVRVRREGMHVRARQSYLAPSR